MEYTDNTIFERFKQYVDMERHGDILVAQLDAALDFIGEHEWVRVAVVPTLKGFRDIQMVRDDIRSEAYRLSAMELNPMDRIYYRPNAPENREYGIYNNFIDSINAVKQKLQRVGDLCIVKYKGDGDRMYLDSDYLSPVITKDGWWDTFTLKTGDMPVVESCRYLAHIAGFRLDKEGHIILLAEPFFQLDQDQMIDDYIFNHTERFVVEPVFIRGGWFSRREELNFDEARKIPFKEFEENPYDPVLVEKIRTALRAPTKSRLNLDSLKKVAAENPKVAAKIANCGSLEKYAEIVLDSWWNLYCRGYVPNAEWLGEKALLVIDYYEKKKEAEKAARKAAKAARKQKTT